MGCGVSREQLWSWVDRDAPELTEHLERCTACRKRTDGIREKMQLIASGSSVVIPPKVGPYTIRRLLGEGGQALVYEAEQPDPRRTVALKVLKGGRFAGESLVRHFRRESQALARLKHPAVATIHEAGRTDEGLHYFAMELVDGLPLEAYVRRKRATREERLLLFLEICDAIEHAHRQGVIHRDLKPSNIIVSESGRPKILDFGLARLVRAQADATGTQTGQIAGTPRYMSPEQARGLTRAVDARTDVYSLGVILYELLAGRPPHDIHDLTPEALKSLRDEVPVPPSRVRRSVGGELDTIVLTALEKDIDRRYATVAELSADIRRFLNAEPIHARPAGRLYRARKALYRHRRGVAVGAIVVAATAVGLMGLRPDRRTPVNLDGARQELLRIRRDLLHGDTGASVVSRASEAARFHGDLTEATLVFAQAISLSRPREPYVASQILKKHLEVHTDRWPYRVLIDEIEGRSPVVDSEGPIVWSPAAGQPDSAEGWYLRSFATLDVRRALEWAEEAYRRDPRYPPALETLAMLYPIVGDTNRALDRATRLVELDHQRSYWMAYKVELLFGISRFREALAECDRLVSEFPETRHAQLLRARTLRRLGRYEEAVRHYSRAIDLSGADATLSTWLYYHRGTLLWMLGRDEDAISDYRRAYRSLRYATHVNARLFLILMEHERHDQAREMLAEARERVGGNSWLAAILSCLAGKSTPEQLIAAASDPVQRSEAYYYAGEVALLEGRSGAARKWFEKCVDAGVDTDPSEFWEPLSEYELASWRLSALS